MEFNYVTVIMIPIINGIGIFVAGIFRNYSYLDLIPELLLNFAFYYAIFFVKRYEHVTNKKLYFEIYKNEQYINYIKEFIDAINTQVICVDKNNLLFMNKFASNFHFCDIPEMKQNDDIKENEINNVIEMKNKVFSFFNSLKKNLSESLNNNETGTFFDKIMKFFSENENSVHFRRIGYFHSIDDSECFDIFIRKLYDITEIRQAEKIKIESKYKKRILAKIAHEFKTPLITIISLINRIMQYEKDFNLDSKIKMNLNHIDNLSNYTLVLISDIIQYVSDSNDLKLFKKEISIKDVVEFSNDVLETLIKCNENKASRLQCKLIIGEGIDKVKVFSDENRLKQIMLNFVSNSFKFTLNGMIKIKAKYLANQNVVEISVKDTGIGIKEENHHLVFQEFSQFSKDLECNKLGSGLGLSICKVISDALGHKIGFSSKFGKGSKFYMLVSCRYSDENSNIGNNSVCYNKNKIITTMVNRLSSKSVLSELIKNKEIENDENIEVKIIDKQDDSESNSSNIRYYEKDQEIYSLVQTKDREKIILRKVESSSSENVKFCFVVIDDQQLVRENTVNLIKIVLLSLNICSCSIIEGTDGIELLNILRLDKDKKIKCIFIDENMEYLNGSETASIIRKLEQNNKFRSHLIVSISAMDDIESKQRLLKSGVDIVIPKPCTKSDLKNILSRFK